MGTGDLGERRTGVENGDVNIVTPHESPTTKKEREQPLYTRCTMHNVTERTRSTGSEFPPFFDPSRVPKPESVSPSFAARIL